MKKVKLVEKFEGFNNDFYDKFNKSLSEEKLPIIEKIKKYDLGQIILPTGTGKSIIQKKLIYDDLKDDNKNPKSYLIASHRLLLNKQLLMKLCKDLMKLNIEYNVLFIGSDTSLDDDYDKIENEVDLELKKFLPKHKVTTNSTEISTFLSFNYENKIHTIIVSTYNSIDRLNKIKDRIDIGLFDEAHTIVSVDSDKENFKSKLESVALRFKKRYFFTATRKILDSEFGMNDKLLFGDIIFEMSNRYAIENKYILKPRIHLVNSTISKDKLNTKEYINTTIHAFEEHKKQLNNDSFDGAKIGAKMLVCLNNQKDLSDILNDKTFKEYCIENKISTLGISSKFKYLNSEETNRDSIEYQLKEYEDTEDVIMFHLRILTEGIDVPSLTSVLVFNYKELITLSQTIGRCIRLLESDRENISLNKKFKDLIKPFGYIILPLFLKEYNMSKMKKMIKHLYSTYDIIPSEIITPEKDSKEKEERLPGDGDDVIEDLKGYIVNMFDEFEEVYFDDLKESILDEVGNDYMLLFNGEE